ncbi:MAG: hypothetical protein RL339_2322 [Pseudomonadota bacterium]
MDALQFELIATIPAQCELGEGPVWDGRIGVLWFTDIQQSKLLSLEWPSRKLSSFDVPERLGSLGLTPDPERLVCALASGFAWFEPHSGKCSWISRTEPQYQGIRMNDGRVDRAGRFWAGSMVERRELSAGRGGALYRLDSGTGRGPEILFGGFSISNSICFSPSGDQLYFADTPTREIRVFDCNPETGALGNSCRFAAPDGPGSPDGSDVDAAGRLWNAEWGSGQVTVYQIDGSVLARVVLPVSQVTCIAFGGDSYDTLFVTTAREGLSAEQLEREPQAGDVFIYRTNARGLPATPFAG